MATLTERQHEVLEWMFKGKEDSEIAQILGLEPRTIKSHARNILSRLGAYNRRSACYMALKLGILKSPYVPPPLPEPAPPPEEINVVSKKDQVVAVVRCNGSREGDIKAYANQEIELDGKRFPLEGRSFDLFLYFVRHANVVHTRDEILNHVWGRLVVVEERTVDVQVRRLRQALNGSGWRIETVRDFGYQFSASH